MLGRLPFAVCVRVPSPEDGDRGVAPPRGAAGPRGTVHRWASSSGECGLACRLTCPHLGWGLGHMTQEV